MRCLSVLAALLSIAPTFAADVVYVSVAGEKRIAIYQIDSADGRLTRVGDTPTTGEPGALTTDVKRQVTGWPSLSLNAGAARSPSSPSACWSTWARSCRGGFVRQYGASTWQHSPGIVLVA